MRQDQPDQVPVGAQDEHTSKRVLEPIDRVLEVLFGLIMVLTFTGSLSAAQSGRGEVREMLLGALGCNLAWGLIDGIMYLMSCLVERAQRLRTVLAVRAATTPEEGQRIVAGAANPAVAEALSPAALDAVRLYITRLPEPPSRPSLRGEDWRGAFGVLVLVFLSTIPVLVPFILMRETTAALRVSNLIAISMMFACGYTVGRLTGFRAWLSGLLMVALGAALVGITMALGG
jgi:hypothetical protein